MLYQRARGQVQGIGRAAGLTLIEILAAVFVLSMGLILVGAAFPVGVQQSEMMREEMETSMFANEVVNMIKANDPMRKVANIFDLASPANHLFMKRYPRNVARPLAVEGIATATPVGSPRWYLVRNSARSAYEIGSEDWIGEEASQMANLRGGDWYCHPYVTRLTADAEVPMYRLTLIMRRLGDRWPAQYWEISIASVTNQDDPRVLNWPSNRNMNVTTTTPGVFIGDTVMDSLDGHCYRVVDRDTETRQITLDRPLITRNMTGGPGYTSRNFYVLGRVNAVYYALLSH
jgi:hypothetical protein